MSWIFVETNKNNPTNTPPNRGNEIHIGNGSQSFHLHSLILNMNRECRCGIYTVKFSGWYAQLDEIDARCFMLPNRLQ